MRTPRQKKQEVRLEKVNSGYALVTDEAFTPDREFIPFPEMAVEPFLKLWKNGVFKLLLKQGKITAKTVADMNSWKHSGFSIHKNVLINAEDKVGLEGLTQYIARCPFSLDRIMKLTKIDHVVYKAENPKCRRFPEPGDDRLKVGVNRKFHTASSDLQMSRTGVRPVGLQRSLSRRSFMRRRKITQHVPNHCGPFFF